MALGRFPSLENGYPVKGMARYAIKAGDLFTAADNYWCLVTCQNVWTGRLWGYGLHALHSHGCKRDVAVKTSVRGFVMRPTKSPARFFAKIKNQHVFQL